MPAESIGDEISQLTRKGPSSGPEKGKPYPQKRAIAAALNMKRAGKFGRKGSKRIGRKKRSR